MKRNYCGNSSDKFKQGASSHEDDNGGDDKFFEHLRKTQSENDEAGQGTVVDSTPRMMFLDTHHDDIPSLTSNITPTSISSRSDRSCFSTTMSEDQYKPNGIINTSLEEIVNGSSATSNKKRRTVFRLAKTVIFLLSLAIYVASITTLTDLLFQDHGEELGLPNISNQCSNLDGYVSKVEGQENASQAQLLERKHDKFCATQRLVKQFVSAASTTTYATMQQIHQIIQNLERGISLAKIMPLSMITVQQITKRVASKLVTTTSEVSQYVISETQGMIFRAMKKVQQVATHVVTSLEYIVSEVKNLISKIDHVTKELASINVGIQVNRHNTIGSRESLNHIGTSAFDMTRHLNQVSKKLASTNAKIHTNSYNIAGVRESFTYVGSLVGKRAGRIATRELKIRSIDI